MTAADVQQEGGGVAHAPTGPATRVGRWLRLDRYPRTRAVVARILDRYPPLPPAREGLAARIGLAVVAALSLAYVAFFTAFLWALQDAYQTHAEDLGIIDQALWNTLHGAVLHQTICNVVSDTNCLGDVSRLGIHFEPIMFPIALLYVVAPSPKTLQFFQAAVVAAGAFPTYWIASRRLRSAFAGVIFAAVYLLYPALQAAVTYDFHAVTLSAAFLMFALYFMLTRNDRWLIVCCLLALSTKENMVADVAMIGLSIAALQRRPRLGLGLVGLSVAWLAIELVVIHIASPLGHSPTAGRYAYLGSGPLQVALYLLTHPLQVIRDHVLDPGGREYLRVLLAPAAYLPLLSPLTLLMAVPTLGINLLSSDPTMRTGIYQYNADIVPVLVLAAVESVAVLAGGAGWLAAHAGPTAQRAVSSSLAALGAGGARLRGVPVSRAVMFALTLLLLLFGLHEQQYRGYTPLNRGFVWPKQTAHSRLAVDLERLIPPGASVSAQSDLVPHISQRRYVYMYPYMAEQSDMVFLDVTSNFYPFATPQDYADSVHELLSGDNFHVVAAKDGYLLLGRGAGPAGASDPFRLPPSFYTFAVLPPGRPTPHPLVAQFGGSLVLAGYTIAPSTSPLANTYVTITTYWKVTAPLTGDYAPQLVLISPDGSQTVINDFAAQQWLPPNRWQPGQTVMLRTWPIVINGAGTLHLGMRVYFTAADDDEAQEPLTATVGSPGEPEDEPHIVLGGTLVIFAAAHVRKPPLVSIPPSYPHLPRLSLQAN